MESYIKYVFKGLVFFPIHFTTLYMTLYDVEDDHSINMFIVRGSHCITNSEILLSTVTLLCHGASSVGTLLALNTGTRIFKLMGGKGN